MDVHDKLDELSALVENARAMPMSASCVVNRGELLALVEEVRELLPEEFRHAELLLHDRESVIDEGRREARRLIEAAASEAARLVAETELLQQARHQADQITEEAHDDAAAMRREVDDYVDTKLANFEVVLERTLVAVHRGRDRLQGVAVGDNFGDDSAHGHPLDDRTPQG